MCTNIEPIWYFIHWEVKKEHTTWNWIRLGGCQIYIFSVLLINTSKWKLYSKKGKNNQCSCHYLWWIVSFKDYSECTMKNESISRTHWLFFYYRIFLQIWVERKTQYIQPTFSTFILHYLQHHGKVLNFYQEILLN